MSKLIVVIGITGNQGGSVATVFSQEAGWNVRGITRNTNSPKALAWSSKGVEMVSANLEDPASLGAAFSGASAIFLTTDFWAPFYNPSTKSLLEDGQTLNEYCYAKELQQVKNVADAAAEIEGLERFVVSSQVDVEKLSVGKYKWVYHWDSKARGVQYVRERYLRLAGKMSEVLVGNYMGNWLGDLKFRKVGGSYRLGLVGSGTKPLPHLDTETDLGYIIRAAIQAAPGKKILGVGDMISWSGMLKVWCEHNKVPFGGFDPLSVDMFERFLPIPGLGRELGEMMAFMDEFGYDGSDESVVLPTELGVPCPLTSWEEYVKKQDWSGVLNA